MISRKKIIAFDLDGTLTQSKSDIDQEMGGLLCQLMEHRTVAVISGGDYNQLQKQLLSSLRCSKNQLKNLLILPTSGASLFQFQNNTWKKVYQNVLTTAEKYKILNAFEKSFQDIRYSKPKKKYGEVIEDRKSQITFSALGQKAPLAQKEEWNKTKDIRPQLQSALEKYLPELEIRLGGLTSIDVTKKSIDKAYGITQIIKHLSLSKKEVVYIGDALYKGGNDYAVKRMGVATIEVKDLEETKNLVRRLLTALK